MIKKTFRLALILFLAISSVSRADEGMWIPMYLHMYNIKDMQDKGFKLTAEDIYSINKACMKDAVMIFGGGCTGELISDQGLLITNHHCGYGSIQKQSSLQNDYLTNGFWAMSKAEELSNPGLTVTFLERMEDVTSQVLANVNDNMTEYERQVEIQRQIKKLEIQNSENGKFKTSVKPFFYGNEFYLFVSTVYRDVRLVGAPPSGIGKFGGDTDNWMWPRHTGDFSLFRIYANKNNEPADYSINNVPFKPKMHFSISLKGVKKDDFTMVFGYPGRTEEYLTSYAVKMISEVQNPHRINIRQNKIDIITRYMNMDPAIRIQYSAKHAGLSNAWKKWIGENRGIKRLDAIAKKEEFEKNISAWIKADDSRNAKYGDLLVNYKQVYDNLSPYQLAYEYYTQSINSLDIIGLTNGFKTLLTYNDSTSQTEITNYIQRLKTYLNVYFKDYYLPLDKEVFAKMINLYYKNLDNRFIPQELKLIDSKFKGDISLYVDYLYNKTMFADKTKLEQFLNEYKVSSNKKMLKDPLFNLSVGFSKMYDDSIDPATDKAEILLITLNRKWMQAIMQFKKDKILYPDANFTLRISYGKIDDYFPFDGVKYLHYTTLKGIMEKDNPEIYDYTVPAKLKELYNNKDYGEYAENGEMHVAFTASNHTTGGNSGSPVLNAEGHLIGVNFDRNWEGTMSDIIYDPEMCRNISIDIRYALFIIDKMAGAKHLINEMTIVR